MKEFFNQVRAKARVLVSQLLDHLKAAPKKLLALLQVAAAKSFLFLAQVVTKLAELLTKLAEKVANLGQ